MNEGNHRPSGFVATLGRLARTGAGALRLRAELFAVEWQEERVRMAEVMLLGLGVALLGLLGLMLLTAIIIFLFPPSWRLYVMGAFALLYWVAAAGVWVGVRSRLGRAPFEETIEQTRKDAECLSLLE